MANKYWEQIAYPKVWENKQTIMINYINFLSNGSGWCRRKNEEEKVNASKSGQVASSQVLFWYMSQNKYCKEKCFTVFAPRDSWGKTTMYVKAESAFTSFKRFWRKLASFLIGHQISEIFTLVTKQILQKKEFFSVCSTWLLVKNKILHKFWKVSTETWELHDPWPLAGQEFLFIYKLDITLDKS